MGLLRWPQRKASRWAKSRHRGGQATPLPPHTHTHTKLTNPAITKFGVQMTFPSMRQTGRGHHRAGDIQADCLLSQSQYWHRFPLGYVFDHMLPISHCSSLTPLYPLKSVDAIPLHTVWYVHFNTHKWNIAHYFELKTGLFKHLSETKIRDAVKFEIPFFTLRKSPKRHFPRITSGLTKTPVNYTNAICLQEFSSWKFPSTSGVRHKSEGVINYNSYGSLQDRGLHKYWLCNFKRTWFSL